MRLGITFTTQEEAKRDIPRLLDIEAPNFLSIEPILGEINLMTVRETSGLVVNALSSTRWQARTGGDAAACTRRASIGSSVRVTCALENWT